MKKFEIVALVLSFALFAAPMAYARNCELPHEQLQARCGGDQKDYFNADADLEPETLSAVDKTPKKSARQLLEEYRRKADAYGDIVNRANAEYFEYMMSKKRR